jgi:hypothetical protein
LTTRFGEMVPLSADGEYAQVHNKVQEYLAQHFTRLPNVELHYDAKGNLRSENRQHRIVTGGLVCVNIPSEGDTLGILVEGESVDLDAVCTSCIPELRRLYGYYE